MIAVNESQYIGEPAIVNGDLIKRGGDYERVYALNNEITILVGTDSGYWGNLIEPENSQIPGGLNTLKGEAITSSFLNRHSAKIEAALNTMIINGDAKSITVESFNPSADKIEWTATIRLPDDSIYIYDSATNSGRFIE